MLLLQRDYEENTYVELGSASRIARKIVLELFQPFGLDYSELPNMHTGMHMVESARCVGNALNSNVAVDEMVHRTAKSIVPHTNNRDIEHAFLFRDNACQSIRTMLAQSSSDHSLYNVIHHLRQLCPLLFEGYYFDNSVATVGGRLTRSAIPQRIRVRAIEQR